MCVCVYVMDKNKTHTNPLRFIPGLRRANITMDRKVLADLAVTEPYSFKAVVDTVRSAAPASSSGGGAR